MLQQALDVICLTVAMNIRNNANLIDQPYQICPTAKSLIYRALQEWSCSRAEYRLTESIARMLPQKRKTT